MISNLEFLSAIFGQDRPWCHVTSFSHDPGNIPADQHLKAWRGDYFSRYKFKDFRLENQYFTISTFMADDKGDARRRKALFRATHCIVLDDVKEKLPLNLVQKLPPPSWIMVTSPGSEQWGYILTKPCTDRMVIENLVDGLVEKGVSPSGKDPGMKGVTRYVRLPDGYNTKANKLVNGVAFKVHLTRWNPFDTFTVEELARVFAIDLYAPRRDTRVDGAGTVDDHPLLDIPDLIHIKEVRSEGRFDITCPWVEEHTGGEDSGTAIFTNKDGSMGFKCHHGSCSHRTGKTLLTWVDDQASGFIRRYDHWKNLLAFGTIPQAPSAVVSFFDVEHYKQAIPVKTVTETEEQLINRVFDELRKLPPYSQHARDMATDMLKALEAVRPMDQLHWHETLRNHMGWTKPDLKNMLGKLREDWYTKGSRTTDFFKDSIFVAELNQFYDPTKNIFYTPEAYQNAFAHLAPEARKQALQDGKVNKVDRLGYAPKQPVIYSRGNTVFGNTWTDVSEVKGVAGDIAPYLHHFKVLRWDLHMKHVMHWFAHTLRFPEIKINHMLIFGSVEGAGKDLILHPLIMAMGANSRTIEGDELVDPFNDYIVGIKHLHVNEAHLSDHRQASAVANRLKPYLASPPETLRVNPKNLKKFNIENLLNVTMATNYGVPFKIDSPTRRHYPMWSDFNPRDERGRMMAKWEEYFGKLWEWMENGGAEAVIHHMRHTHDLQDFKPKQPPEVTEFLDEIREASATAPVQMLRAFIDNRLGGFHADLLTTADMINTLRIGRMINPALCYHDPEWFSPVKLGMILKEQGIPAKRLSSARTSMTLYAIRNRQAYEDVYGEDLYQLYLDQKADAKKHSGSASTAEAVGARLQLVK